MKIRNLIAIPAIMALTASPMVATQRSSAINTQPTDTFEYVSNQERIPAEGTTALPVLNVAPSPLVKVNGKEKTARFVVDITKNVLYEYDKSGNANCAYSIASGKASTPTHTGVRIVTHTEDFPYKSAPAGTKRRKNPRDYGPHIILLSVLDTKTGEVLGSNGEFIHGTSNPSSIGKHVSHGCMRMDNDVISQLYKTVKYGDIVVIKK